MFGRLDSKALSKLMLTADFTPFNLTGPASPKKSLMGCFAKVEKCYFESNRFAKSSKVAGIERGHRSREVFFWLRGRPFAG